MATSFKSRRFSSMADSNKTESSYPIWNSCSFLGIDFYEEASNKFEEYYAEALLPECSSLLKDTRYPLENVDEFYRSPWKNAEYDGEFLSKECNIVNETLSKICANLSPLKCENIIVNEELPSTDNLFDTGNFKEHNLQEFLVESSKSIEHSLFEVPLIPNSTLEWKNKTSLNCLLKDIPVMELEDIFERESIVTFQDLEIPAQCNSLMTDDIQTLPEDYEKFKEIILPKIPDENISLECLPLQKKKINLALNSINECSPKIISNERTLGEKTTHNNNRIFESFNDSFYSTAYQTSKECDQSVIYNDNSTCSTGTKDNQQEKLTLDDNKVQTLFNKPILSNCTSHTEVCSQNEYSASHNVNHFNEVCPIANNKLNEKYDDMFKELCSEDFFSENFMDCNDMVDEIVMNKSMFADLQDELNPAPSNNSGVKRKYPSDIQPRKTQSFLSKLSNLDLTKDKILERNDLGPKRSKVDCENAVKTSIAFRNQTSLSERASNENKAAAIQRNACKDESLKSLNILSLFCSTRKIDIMPNEKIVGFSQMSENSSEKDENTVSYLRSIAKVDAPSFEESTPLPEQFQENELQFLAEDIVVKLPDNYGKVVLIYEEAATFYIQKLAAWKGFKLSPELTVGGISLDKTRFLLNQELKNCHDQNINPLEGGINYSHYIQLLILHGILKSLKCLINVDAQLAISVLCEYQKKHVFLKGCFEELTEKISVYIKNLSNIEFVHPKVKALCEYLQEKYYICKGDMIPFKVLVILKEHLVHFYSSFEAFMKTLLPETAIDLIPECCVLEQEINCFSEYEECVFIANVSSVSYNIPWKKLTLVVEYDTDGSACWKTVCSENKVAHIQIKWDPLPLKALAELKNLPLVKKPFTQTSKTERKMIVVVSASMSAEFSLQNVFCEKQNVLVYERSYARYLPHMHFADITIDHNTSIIVLHLMSFLKKDFVENMVDRIYSLCFKYEVCWIIILDDLSNKNLKKEVLLEIQSDYVQFYYTAVNLKSFQSFKVKFLYARTEEKVINWIDCIFSRHLKYYFNKFDVYPVNSLSDHMSEGELFLVSFPSLNPVVASFLMSLKIPLHQLMNLELENLCSKFQFVPERFLKLFHSCIHEQVDLIPKTSEDEQVELYKDDSKLIEAPVFSKVSSLPERLSNSNSEDTFNFTGCIEECHFNEINSDNDPSEDLSLPSGENPYSEMSVEEIDENYKALQLEDMLCASVDTAFGNNDQVNDIELCPSNSAVYGDISAYEAMLQSPKRRKTYHLDSDTENSIYLNENESQPYTLDYLIRPGNSYLDTENSKEYSLNTKEVRFTESPQYLLKRKKNSDADYLNENKSISSTQNSLVSYSRIQKGQSSKTVCKQTWFKNNVPLTQKDVENSQRLFPSTSDFFQMYKPQPLSNEMEELANKPDSTSLEDLDSSWMPQGKISLTPRVSQKLSYERMPGRKGQTRLVFR